MFNRYTLLPGLGKKIKAPDTEASEAFTLHVEAHTVYHCQPFLTRIKSDTRAAHTISPP